MPGLFRSCIQSARRRRWARRSRSRRPTYVWVILGNGRARYLERTVASWEANLLDPPRRRVIFDDSGDDGHFAWLRSTYGDRFDVLRVGEEALGQRKAIQAVFDYVKGLDVDYVLFVEEDWALFRPLRVADIMAALEANPHVLQMRIPRTIWHADYHKLDLQYGSIFLYHASRPGSITAKRDRWYEWRGGFYFWTHNPSVFRAEVCSVRYGPPGNHEQNFGKRLLSRFPTGVSGFWASNPFEGYVTHIGFRTDDELPELNTGGAGNGDQSVTEAF